MPIIVFQHGEHVRPGRLGATLRDHGFKLDIRRLDLPENHADNPRGWVPPDLDGVQGVVSLGGEQNVGERHAWMQAELEFLRRAHGAQLPVIGVCLGHQLIAHALGGKVGPMDGGPEWGFHNVSLNAVGQVEPVLAGIAWDSQQFCAHGYEVKELPGDATPLASSATCKIQAFRAGLRTFGFQYHFECDRAMIEQFAATSADSLARAGMTAADVLAQADRYGEMFARLADRLAVNLVTLCFPVERKMSV